MCNPKKSFLFYAKFQLFQIHLNFHHLYKENVPRQSDIFHAHKQYTKDMAFPGFMNIAAWTLCIFVLETCNHQVQASSRAFSGKESKISPEKGLCASWVTIHGYKCQELEVRIPNILKKN